MGAKIEQNTPKPKENFRGGVEWSGIRLPCVTEIQKRAVWKPYDYMDTQTSGGPSFPVSVLTRKLG